MSRDLPTAIPDEIAFIIRENWGDMKTFADAVELPYTSVYSVLVKSSQRPIRTLEAMAKPLRISMDRLAHILLIENLDSRRAELDDVLRGKSLNGWASESGLGATTIKKAVNNLEQTQISNVVIISEALGLDLKRFLNTYERSQKAS